MSSEDASPSPSQTSTTDWKELSVFLNSSSQQLPQPLQTEIKVKALKKKTRTDDSETIVEDGLTVGFVKSAMNYFKQPWKHIPLGTTIDIPPRGETSFSNLEYELDMPKEEVDLIASAGKDVEFVSFDPNYKYTDYTTSLFHNYPIAHPVSINLRAQGEPYVEKMGMELGVEIVEFGFNFNSGEPFFGTLSLFDFSAGRKISEDFHFQFGEKKVKSEVKRAVFRLSPSSQNKDIYLVLIISRILSGDLDEQYELFSKESWKPKVLQKANDNAKRLEKFHQNFGWSAVSVVDSEGKFINSKIEFDVYKMKHCDVVDLIEDIRKDVRKLKTIPGKFSIELNTGITRNKSFKDRVSPSYQRLRTTELNKFTTKEVQEFTSTSEYPYPYVSYVNNFYLYLQRLDPLPSVHGGSSRNIAIEVKVLDNDDNPDQDGLNLIYDYKESSSSLCSVYISTVWYHVQSPKYLDEVAIQLPTQLTEKHHILINYYHVNVLPKKNSKEDITHVKIASSFIPLLQNGSVVRQKHTARVVTKLSPGYLTKESSIEYADKKSSLTFYTRLISSIYSLDSNVQKFLSTADWDQQTEWVNIINIMKSLFNEKTNQRQIVRFIPVIMKTLFKHISSDNKGLSEEAFDVLLRVNASVASLTMSKDKILESYLMYVFNESVIKSKTGLHNSILERWTGAIRSTDSSLTNSTDIQLYPENEDVKNKLLWLKFSWFLFGVITKSLAFHVTMVKKNKKQSQSKSLFGAEFTRKITHFVTACAEFVRDYHSITAYSSEISRFNIQMGYFFCDMFRLIEWSRVFELINLYFSKLNQKSPETFALKCLMYKVFLQDPLFISLNIPVQHEFQSPNDVPTLWLNKHFLVGLLFKQLELAYESKNPTCRMLVIDTVCDTLYFIANQTFEPDQKRLIYFTLFPFVILIVRYHQELEHLPEEEKRKTLACFLEISLGMPHTTMQIYWNKETEKRICFYFDILKKTVETFEWQGKTLATQIKLSTPPTNPHFQVGRIVLSTVSQQELAPKPIEKSKKTKKNLEVVPSSPSTLLDSKQSTRKLVEPTSDSFKRFTEFCNQASKTVLTLVSNILTNCSDILYQPKIFECVIHVLISLLKTNQSPGIISLIFKRLYTVIDQYGKMLFVNGSSVYGDIVYEVLRKCNSCVKSTRNEATSIFAHLILTNYKKVKNIDLTRLQTTISITKLVGLHSSDSYKLLICSLKNVREYVTPKTFEPRIKDILSKLETSAQTIITNHKKILQYAYDPETISDLYYNLSKQLADYPDERITWLENLANFHKSKENYEEFALTKIVTAALVQGYLSALGRWTTRMIVAFDLVCPSIKEEATIADEMSLKVLQDVSCQSNIFTQEGFASLIKDAIKTLKDAGLYELCIAAYRMLLPVYQENEDYKRLHECHIDLYDLTSKLTDHFTIERRIFSNYYRVGFYGSKFGHDLDGKEFVYKEKNTVLIADFTEKIINQYAKEFGRENIEILPNKVNDVDFKDLDPNKFYLQICAVELYLSIEESVKSDFKQHFGVDAFFMEQPFTKSGRVQGDISDQWLRKTVYQTGSSFPYVKKRVLVKAKKGVDLSPIEYACTLVEKKISFFEKEKVADEPNPKTLQRELQGILLTQVNAGFGAIVNAFLGENEELDKNLQIQLADRAISLENCLTVALNRNKRFFSGNSDDQRLLQEELEKGLQRFTDLLDSFEIVKQRKTNSNSDVPMDNFP